MTERHTFHNRVAVAPNARYVRSSQGLAPEAIVVSSRALRGTECVADLSDGQPPPIGSSTHEHDDRIESVHPEII